MARPAPPRVVAVAQGIARHLTGQATKLAIDAPIHACLL